MVETIERRELGADEVSRLLAAHDRGMDRGAHGALVIAGADPPHVWWANRAAVDLFGGDSAAELDARLFGGAGRQGLAQAAGRLVTDGGVRHERLRLVRGFATRTVPVAISRWSGPGHEVLVLSCAAADGSGRQEGETSALRDVPRGPEPAETPAAQPIDASPPPPDAAQPIYASPSPVDAAVPARLASVGAKRFLWQSDAAGHLTGVSDAVPELRHLADNLLVGRPFAVALGETGVSGTEGLAAALAGQRSFSNIRVAWPLTEPGWATAVILGAVPVRGEAGSFMGFRGFGVTDFAKLVPRQADAEPPAGAAAPDPEPALAVDAVTELRPPSDISPRPGIGVRASFSSAKVVALRPSRLHAVLQSDEAAPAEGAFAARSGALGADDLPNLSLTEQSNFDAIARALRKASAAASARDAPRPAPGDAVALLALLPVAVLVQCAGEVVYANAAFATLAGYASAAELQERGGRHHLLGGLDVTQIAGTDGDSGFPLVAASGEVVPVEGRLVAVEWRGGPAEMLVMRPAADRVAERQGLEIELKRQAAEAAEARTLLDRVEEALAVVDGRGRVLWINAAAQGLFGRQNADAVGESIGAFLSPDSQSAVLGAVFAAGSAGPGRDEVALRATGRRQAGARAYEVRLWALSPGRVGLVIGDRSAGEAAREEARHLRDELDHAAQTRADFLAKVSHEVRTPLNAIIGFAEMMLEERFGPVGNPRYLDYLSDIKGAGMAVIGRLGDLVDLSSVASGHSPMAPAATDVNAVVGESVADLQGQAHRDRVIVRQSLAGNLPRALVDAEAMRQVMDNILSNAIQFNEPGGQVIVSTAVHESGAVVVRVRDTGIGMSDAELAIAMEPFRQVMIGKPGAGSGLGLPLTRALVEANHATLSIRSRKSEGTLVEVALRPAPAEEDAPAA